jgi:hypothetical protein
MELNFISIIYLFLRLSPFILVCFFALASLFNQDFKGLIYLVGLIVTCFISILVGMPLKSTIEELNKLIVTPNTDGTTGKPFICSDMITLGNAPLFNLPIGQTIFGFTFAYLLSIITNPKHNYVSQNIPTLIFFPVIILFDMIWNFRNECFVLELPIALGIGFGFGWLWGYIIESSKMTNLLYFNKISGASECSRPTKSTFTCKVYKNGQLISKNMASR